MHIEFQENVQEIYEQFSQSYRQPWKPGYKTGGSFMWLCVALYALFAPDVVMAQYIPDNTYYGTSNYIEYLAGDLPIIVSAPHGGSLVPPNIPDRVCGNCVTVKDSWTEELAYEIDSAVRVVFGGSPHIIINKLSRKKLDANREIVEAALGNADAETAWHEYHEFVQAAKDSCVANFGSAIYIDLHAHGHSKQRIELGYLLNRTELQLSNSLLDAMNFQDSSSIRHLNNTLNPTASFADILRGSDCMGELLTNRGYPSVPSASDPAPLPSDPYFSGGYNTARHGSRDSSQIDGIQFETNYTGIRNNTSNRKAFASALACALRSYLDQWYYDLDSWDPGQVVSSTADSGPGSLRSALLGAENGSVITFDAAILGDTIRLQRELQLCADVTLRGPGADKLAISGEDTCRILRIMPGNTVEVSGLSLVHGNTSAGEDGGAVLAYGNIKLLSCVLANNYAADDGGALAVVDSAASAQLDSCQVIHNSCGDDGGALRCIGGSLVVNASTVHGNYSPSYGGGLSMSGRVIITHSTFSENEAASTGGGIRNFGGGSLTCINTTLAGNICGYRGAGISTVSAVELNFCTITDNVATSLGGGIRVPTGGTCHLRNTLVASNTGSGGQDVSAFSGVFISQGNNFIGDTTGSSWIPASADHMGNSASPLDPMILALDANGGATETHALHVGSPCIDGADTTSAPLFDQRGKQRISGPRPDIGSYELCMPSTGTDVQTACNSFTWIDGNTYFSDNNTATFTLINEGGCDSVLTLNLTLHVVDTSVTQAGISLQANVAGASYQWLDCQNAMTALPGETQQTFSPPLNGRYAVEITQSGCVDTSACFVVTTVGMAQNDFGKALIVYPNPTSRSLTIDLGKFYHAIDIRVMNLAGQLIQAHEFQDLQKVHVEIAGTPGFYIVEIMTGDNKKASLRVLKEQ